MNLFCQIRFIKVIENLTHEVRVVIDKLNTQLLLTELIERVKNMATKIAEFAASVQTSFDGISADLDAINTGIAKLDDLIRQLQSTPGAITPEDQALLDQIQTTVASLKTKADSIDLTPPVAPTA